MGIVARYIGHSGATVASLFRKRPITKALVATGGVIVAIVGVCEVFPGASKAAQAAAISAIADPAALFDARSPGNRRYGRLQQIKQSRTSLEQTPPSERVLTTERRRPITPEVPNSGLPVIPGIPVDIGLNGQPQTPADVAVNDSAPPTAFFGGVPGAGGVSIGGVPSGSSGGSSGGGGTPGVGNPVIPPPVVPEPTTWMMMFIGLFGIGTVMRRRPGRRRRRAL